MTLTVEISPETAERIASDPEALRHVARMIEDAYGATSDVASEPEPVQISKELADELQSMCEGIEAGTIKVTPWDSDAMRKRGAELLKREFGYEAPGKSSEHRLEKNAA